MIHKYKNITPKIGKNCFIEHSSQVIGDVIIGDNSSVWFNTVIRGDVNKIRIGNDTNIQDGSILHVTYKKHDLNIGNGVTIGHGVILHGCTVHDYSLIGMGAKLLDGCIINKNVLVAAGTVVLQGFEVPSGKLIAGVPGKIIRDLTEEEMNFFYESAENYKMYMKDYMIND